MLDDFRDSEEGLNKNGEFLDEFRQRLNSQPLENLEDRKNDINRSQHVFLGTILGIGLAGVVSWFILSPDYNKAQDAEIPVVRRPQTAVKIQPADPGGMEILNQDKTVYDMVEKKSESEEIKVENLLPPPEEPQLPEIASDSKEQDTTGDVIADAEKILKMTENTAPVAAEEIKVVKEEQPQPKEDLKIVVKEPEAPAKTEEKTKKAEIAQNMVAPVGSWQIQLISSPNKSAMEKAWVDLTKKHSELKNLPHEVESADLGSKGTFYRLKAGAFADRDAADKLCNAIKTAGGSCLVKKK